MRLTETIETTGAFWMPDRPDSQLSGVLKISESCEITLELAGIFEDPLATKEKTLPLESLGREDGDPERILGILDKGGPAILDHCMWQNIRYSWSSGLSSSIVHADLVSVGVNHQLAEGLYTDVAFTIEGLDLWLSISGIETELDRPNKSGLIRYRVPEEISLNLSSDVTLEFRFGLSFPSVAEFRTEASLTQTVQAVVSVREPQSIEYFSAIAFKLCNFLTLALDEPVCLQSVTGLLDRDADDNRTSRTPVKIYGRFPPWTEEKPILKWHDAVFRYPDVERQLEETLSKWFNICEKFGPAFDLYFASKTHSSLFLETRVLWLVQALEALHRRMSTETEMPVEEFHELRKSVVRRCPTEKKEWLNNRLRYVNELSLRRRIRRLLQPFGHWFGARNDREAFINMVCDTRNYLSHYDEKTTGNRASDPEEWFDLLGKLEALFQLLLLDLIGFDTSFIESVVLRNRKLRRRLDVKVD